MKNKSYSLFVLSCLFCGCSTVSDTNESQLVGNWKESCGTSKTIILRNSDGTYFQKSLKSDVISESPTIDEFSGKWAVKGDVYSEKIEYTNNERWKNAIGKTYKMKIKSITSTKFQYYSTDDADCEQTKVGSASMDLFKKLKLN